jgi:hypothetical protein
VELRLPNIRFKACEQACEGSLADVVESINQVVMPEFRQRQVVAENA